MILNSSQPLGVGSQLNAALFPLSAESAEPGTIINDIAAHEDMLPTLLAAAGNPNVKDELLKGKRLGDMTYKVHLDGYNLLPPLTSSEEWCGDRLSIDRSSGLARYNASSAASPAEFPPRRLV